MKNKIQAQNLFSISRQKLQIADYLLFHAYPMCNDPKLLVRIVNILYQSYYLCLGAIFELNKLEIDSLQKTKKQQIIAFLDLIEKDIPLTNSIKYRKDLEKSVFDISSIKKVINPSIVKCVFSIFQEKIAKENLYESSIFESFLELGYLIDFQKKSPVGFARKENYVICSTDYELKILNHQKIKKLTRSIKQFLFESKLIFKFD